jgi:hypothetical protein
LSKEAAAVVFVVVVIAAGASLAQARTQEA